MLVYISGTLPNRFFNIFPFERSRIFAPRKSEMELRKRSSSSQSATLWEPVNPSFQTLIHVELMNRFWGTQRDGLDMLGDWGMLRKDE